MNHTACLLKLFVQYVLGLQVFFRRNSEFTLTVAAPSCSR